MSETRPTHLTKETQDRICKAVADGNTRQVSAALADIGYSTFMLWMRRGKQESGSAYELFRLAVKRAEAEATDKAIKAVRAAGERQWQAYAWWLERKYPEEWSLNRNDLKKLAQELAEAMKHVPSQQIAPQDTGSVPSAAAAGEGSTISDGAAVTDGVHVSLQDS